MNATRMVAALVAAFSLAIFTGCGSSTDKSSATTSPAPSANPTAPVDSTITFVVSGDTAGFIVPCGCTTKQFGGLPRRATYLKEARKQFGPRLIYVDAGGNVQRGSIYDQVKLEYIWKGVSKMGVQTLNLGSGEMTISPAKLEEMVSDNVYFLSTHSSAPTKKWAWITQNCIQEFLLDGKPVFHVAFEGVNLNAKEGGAFNVVAPRTGLKQNIDDLSKNSDLLVLLAYGDEHEAIKLAADFPEFSAVFVSGCDQSFAPRVENGLIVAGVAQKGKFLMRATLTGHRNNWKLASGEIVELSESFADDPGQIENLNAYKQRLKELKIDPKDSGEVPALLANLPADYRYAGSAACAKCHVQDSAIFSKTQHAHGLETLRAKDFAFDPFCLKCHTTGYGGPGGFVNADATPALGGIGCENCHGPGQAHAANPRVKTPTTDSKHACATCHDPENSPKFEYNAYWQKIAHGQEKLK